MLVLTLKFRASPELVAIWVVDEHVKPESSARNLGELFDTYLLLNDHFTKLCKATQIEPRTVKIMKFIAMDFAEILIHAFVS